MKRTPINVPLWLGVMALIAGIGLLISVPKPVTTDTSITVETTVEKSARVQKEREVTETSRRFKEIPYVLKSGMNCIMLVDKVRMDNHLITCNWTSFKPQK
jgi:hypothetical protein